jgi:hypothetical protein
MLLISSEYDDGRRPPAEIGRHRMGWGRDEGIFLVNFLFLLFQRALKTKQKYEFFYEN